MKKQLEVCKGANFLVAFLCLKWTGIGPFAISKKIKLEKKWTILGSFEVRVWKTKKLKLGKKIL